MKYCHPLRFWIHLLVLWSLFFNTMLPAFAASTPTPYLADSAATETYSEPLLATPETEPILDADVLTLVHTAALSGTITNDAPQNPIYLPHILKSHSTHPNTELFTIPETGGQITTADGRVTLTLPAEAVDTPTRLRYTPDSSTSSGGLSANNVAPLTRFTLEAWRLDTNQPLRQFAAPIDISVQMAQTATPTPTLQMEAGQHRIALPTVFDNASQTYTAQSSRLTTYVLSDEITALAAAELAPAQGPFDSTTVPNRYYENTVSITIQAGDTVWLSGLPDGSGALSTDDEVIVYLGAPDTTQIFRNFFVAPEGGIEEIPPQDLTAAFPGAGTYDVSIVMNDLIFPSYGGSAYYLFTGPSGVDVIPLTIYNMRRWFDGQGNLVIQAEVFDDTGVGDVNITFNGNSYPLVDIGGGLYQAVIPATNDVKSGSLEVTATDTNGTPNSVPAVVNDVLTHPTYRLGGHVCKSGCPPGTCPCDADPVNSANGNLTYQTTDLVIPGVGDTELTITRDYNSLVNGPVGEYLYEFEEGGTTETFENVHPDPMGPGWTFSFGMSLLEIDFPDWFTGVQVRFPDGHTEEFRETAGGFEAVEPHVFNEMRRDGADYVLRRKNGTDYRFNAEGRLAGAPPQPRDGWLRAPCACGRRCQQ